MEDCACSGKGEYKFHTTGYCGDVPKYQAFPPCSLEPRCFKGSHGRSNRVKVELTLQLPIDGESSTAAQIEEWLRFNFGDNGLLNPSPISESALPEPLVFEWGWSY